MKSENPQAYLVTVPYDDFKGMEAQTELLEEIKNNLTILLGHSFMNNNIKINVEAILEKIRKARRA